MLHSSVTGVCATLLATLVGAFVLLALFTQTPLVHAQNAGGAPAIRGVLEVGLTAAADITGVTDSDGLTYTYNGTTLTTFSFQWIRVDGVTETDIDGATDDTYPIQAADLGKRLKLRVTFQDDDSNEETLTSAASATVGGASHYLVGNLGQSQDFNVLSGISNTALGSAPTGYYHDAQAFTVGGVGATLTGVRLRLGAWPGSIPTVSIHTDSSGAPGTGGTTLTSPTNVDRSTASVEDFTHAGVTLTANATYWVVIEAASGKPYVGGTSATAHDTAVTGWSIADGSKFKSSASASLTDSSSVQQLAVLGSLASNVAATGDPTVQGTLEPGLLARADTSAIRDDNGLAQVSYSYQWFQVDGTTDTMISGANDSTYLIATADVGKALKVRATFNDDGNYPETRTSGASALITAAPTTYLVKNLAQANGQILDIPTVTQTSRNGEAYAQQFTVGSRGVTLQSVRLPMGVDTGVVPKVTIHADDSGTRGSSLGDLTNPTSIDGSTDTVESFTTSGLVLKAGTPYWVSLHKTSLAAGEISLRATSATREDANASQGWSVGDTVYERASGTSSFSSVARTVLKVAILGEQVANQAATGAPELQGILEAGLVLNARFGDMDDPNGVENAFPSYQWILVDGLIETDISGAGTRRYRVKATDVGKTLKLRASFNDDAGYPESRTSAASSTIGAAETYLVSNLGQDNARLSFGTQSGLSRFAQPFTTGSQKVTLSGVLARAKTEMSVPEGTTVRTEIVSDNNGRPGTFIHTFGDNNSTNTLSANTKYWLVVYRVTGDGEFSVFLNSATGFDTDGTGDWSIDGNIWYLWNGVYYQWFSADNPVLVMRMGLQGEEGDAPTFTNVMPWRNDELSFYVDEFAGGGEDVGTVTAGHTANATLTYSIEGADAAAFNEDFSLNSSTGQITVKTGATLDYDQKSTYRITFVATDTSNNRGAVVLEINLVEGRAITGIPEVGEIVSIYIPNFEYPDGYWYAGASADDRARNWVKVDSNGAETELAGAGLYYKITEGELGTRLRNWRPYTLIRNVVHPSIVGDDLRHYRTTPTARVKAASSYLGSNLDNKDDTVTPPQPTNPRVSSRFSLAQQFTTDAGLFELVAVRLRLASPLADPSGITVSIYTDASGVPGMNVGTLTSPDHLDNTSETSEEFTTSGITLSGSTTYWVVVESTLEPDPRTGQAIYLDHAITDAQASGWSIGDSKWIRDNSLSVPYWREVASSATRPFRIGFRGAETHTTPSFADASVTFRAQEHADAGVAVGTVVATDADHDSLTYSVSGTDLTAFNRDFFLSDFTGKITVKEGATIDYEIRSSYSVTISVTDGEDASGNAQDSPTVDDTIEVTINVADLYEPVSHNQLYITGILEVGLNVLINTERLPIPETHEISSYKWFRVDGDSETEVNTTFVYPIVAADFGHNLKARANYYNVGSPEETELSFTSESGRVRGASSYLGSNLGGAIPGLSGLIVSRDITLGVAQAFTTGSNTTTLSAVRMNLGTTGVRPKVSIYSDSSGSPGTSLHVLTNPASIDSATFSGAYTTEELTASGVTLAANTKYWVVVESPDGVKVVVGSTNSTSQATGWAIDDDHFRMGADETWVENPSSDTPIVIGLMGEATHSAPSFATKPLTFSVAENVDADTAVGTAGATDSDGDPLTYSLSGTDATAFNQVFAMSTYTGAITVKEGATVDYESKSSYAVTVSVTDGEDASGNTEASATTDDTVNVTINVTNVEEPGVVSLSAATPTVGVALMATLTDPDGSVTSESWTWESSTSSTGTFTPVSMVTVATLTPGSGDVGKFYKAKVSYTDALGPGKTAEETSANPTGSNPPPVFPNTAETFRIDENATSGTVGTVTATDPANETITYSVGGTDAMAFNEDFSLNTSTGEITVKTGATVDYEDKTSYSVTITATDTGSSTATVAVTINVTNLDEQGVVSLSAATPAVGVQLIATLVEPDGGVVNPAWVWSSATSRTGQFTVIPRANTAKYTPVTGDFGKYLKATVSYTDALASGKSESVISTRGTVENPPPEFADDSKTFSVTENATSGTVGTVTATDQHNEIITYTAGGPAVTAFDQDFRLDSGTGAITVKPSATIDYETRDSYSVTITATDTAAGTDTIDVTINVTNADDAGEVSLSAATPSIGAPLTATLTDPDGGVTGESWTWSSASTRTGTFTPISGANTATYTPVQGDVGNYLKATVSYTDSFAWGRSAEETSDNAVITDPPPEFPNAAETFTVIENEAANTVVGTVTATDPDNQPITYSVGGTDAAEFNDDFDLSTVSGSGRITVKSNATIDYEDLASYSVTISAADSFGVTATVDVTINVTNVDEPGAVTLSASTPAVGRQLTATLSDPDGSVSGQSWTWSRSASRIGGYTPIPGANAVTYTPANADLNRYLRATVTYTDALGPRKSASGTAANATVANPPPEFGETSYTFTVTENSTSGPVGTVTATDPENDTFTYSVGGTDANEFNDDFDLNSSTGAITVKSDATINYETRPSYSVAITATDQHNSSNDVPVTINVTNADDAGEVSLSAATPSIGAPLIATLTDPDGGVSGKSWTWSSASTRTGTFTPISGANLATYTPVAADVGNYLKATVTYTDSFLTSKSASKTSDNPVVTDPPPEFGETSYTFTFDENSTSGMVGTVTATDPDGQVVTYSVGGTDAADFNDDFDLSTVSGSGRITVKSSATIDYETKSAYTFTAIATDTVGVSGTVAVTINVENLDEPGAVTLSEPTPTEGRPLTATLTDPDGGVTGDSWTWSRSASSTGTFTPISGSTGSTYTPGPGDVGRYLKATVTYADGQGGSKRAERVSDNAATEDLTIPSPVRGLKASAQDGWVGIFWREPSRSGDTPLAGYEYRYARGSSVPENVGWQTVGSSSGTNKYKAVSKLTNDTLYTFEVRAVNNSGKTSAPSQVQATPRRDTAATEPDPPSSFTATPGDVYLELVHRPPTGHVERRPFAKVTLQWTEPADHGNSRDVSYRYRYAEGSSVPDSTEWLRVDLRASGDLVTTIRGLKPGVTYTFEMATVGDGGLSAPMSSVRVRTPAYTGPSVTLSVSGSAREGQPYTLTVNRSGPADSETVAVFEIDDTGVDTIQYAYAILEEGQRRATGTYTPPDDGQTNTGRQFTVRHVMGGLDHAWESIPFTVAVSD